MLLRECQTIFPVPEKKEADLENPIFPSSERGLLQCLMPWHNDGSRFAGKWHFYDISDIVIYRSEDDPMCQKFTADELNIMDHETKNDVIYRMQDRLDRLEHDYENLMEQVRLADQQRFGRHTEKLSEIAGQISLFNEVEACFDEQGQEPAIDDVVDAALKPPRKKKKKGQKEEDLRAFPQEEIPHDVPAEKLDALFGEGNYKSMPDEICWQLRFEPARWTAEKHIIKVYVGTDGLHQDEFLRGDHPDTLYRGSIATPSLLAGIINSKYVNSSPLDRTAREFQTNGLHLSKQTMSNWVVWSAERFFQPVYGLMKRIQLQAHVNQCDETPLEVIHDDRPAGSKSYMWVHLTGELSPCPKIIVYEYQKTRHSDHPKEYYKDFKGVLMTDGEVPIDDSASERALRNFTIGRKNWMTINTVRGAQASAVIYSITETARANGLNVYYYIKYLLEQLVTFVDKQGNIEQSELEPLMPWSKALPADCYSKRRN